MCVCVGRGAGGGGGGGFIHIREMSGNFFFFQGQRIVREFCDVSGKNEIMQNVREMSGNFTF